HPHYMHLLAIKHQRVADLEDAKDALTSRLAARALLEQLVQTYPSVAEYAEDLARAHHGISFLQVELGDRKEALKSRQAVCLLKEKLVQLQPDRLDRKVDLGGSYCKWGEFLAVGGEYDKAEARYRKAIDIVEPLIDRKLELREASVVL